MKAIFNWAIRRIIKAAEKELKQKDITPERKAELENALVELRASVME